MPKDDSLYVGHMLDKAREALALLHAKSRKDFDSDVALRLALMHLIQVIGEAARHVSPQFQTLHPQLPWDAIIGMRHKIVHNYMGVDEEIVWDTVKEELPVLITAFEDILPPEQS